jgi:hypothetical protein
MKLSRILAGLPASLLLSLTALTSHATETQAEVGPAEREVPAPVAPPVAYHAGGDLFPTPGRPSVSAATGLPFLGIAEVGMGITNGFAIGIVGGVTPSVLTAGIRPRFRVRTSERIAFMLSSPMLWYPKASAPGPGNIGNSTWVLARPELMLDGTVSDRVHIAGGMGIIAAASTEAIANKLQGKEFAVPAYAGSSDVKHGFAGGVWNTIAMHSSYALGPQTHLFAEGSLVMSGIALADNVGGPPFVVNFGAQHTF